jgi:hypothetical protein
MSARRKALLLCAIALIAVVAALLLRDDRHARFESLTTATTGEHQRRQPPPQVLAPAAPQPPAAAERAVAPPIFDVVRVEKEEVCEGEENLVTVRAHTTDGNDAFLHYTVAGEAGAQVPVRAYIGRDGQTPVQYAVAFSKDNVATRIELPPYPVRNCRPARILIVTMRMLPNSVGEREFTATVQPLDGVPFTPAWYEWSFGDETFEVTPGPVAMHDYSGSPQRTAFTDFLVKVRAIDGSGQSVEGRFPLHIRNVAFAARQRGMVAIFAEPTPRFPAIGPDGVVHQKFRVWHAEDVPVQVTGATMSRLLLPSSPGTAPPAPEVVAIDHARLLRHGDIPPGTRREESLDYDFGADPAAYAVTYEIQGATPAGMQARGNLTLLRPPPKPSRENSIPIEDPAMLLKIRRAMAILNQESVSQEDLWRLEREGKLQ